MLLDDTDAGLRYVDRRTDQEVGLQKLLSLALPAIERPGSAQVRERMVVQERVSGRARGERQPTVRDDVRRSPVPSQSPATRPAGATARVAVIIPAHNEAANIGRTIRSLRGQTLPPDDIIVICDKCTDDTARIAIRHGATVLETVRNRYRKAGALNQGLGHALPLLDPDDLVLTIDADSQLHPDWIRSAQSQLGRRHRRAGAVCGTVTGSPSDRGLLRLLQKNEYVRGARTIGRASSVHVLSGCGTLFRVFALRQVAAMRGGSLPGYRGEFFNTDSITEDYEITLALKSLGWLCLFSPESIAVTELMPTWKDLLRQRLRWQIGTLQDLRRYGFSAETWRDWLKQAVGYATYVAMAACWAIIGWFAITAAGVFSLRWGALVLTATFVERAWTARRTGGKGVLLAALMAPEFAYGWFEGFYLTWAAFSVATGRRSAWHHTAGDAT